MRYIIKILIYKLPQNAREYYKLCRAKYCYTTVGNIYFKYFSSVAFFKNVVLKHAEVSQSHSTAMSILESTPMFTNFNVFLGNLYEICG